MNEKEITFAELIELTGLNARQFALTYNIPVRTCQNWQSNDSTPPPYVLELLKYRVETEKMEGMIMMNAEETLKKAREMDEFKNDLPEVKVGDVVNLETIWDGNGEVPEESYSYKLTDTDWINYEFEVVEAKEDELKTLVKITDIILL